MDKRLRGKEVHVFAVCALLPWRIGHWARQLTLTLGVGCTKSKTNSQTCTSLPLTLWHKNFDSCFFVVSRILYYTYLNVDGAVPDLFPGHVKFEGGVEDGVQVALVDRCFLFLHSLLTKH